MGQHPTLNKAEVVDKYPTHLCVLSFSSSYEIGIGTEQFPSPSMNLNLCGCVWGTLGPPSSRSHLVTKLTPTRRHACMQHAASLGIKSEWVGSTLLLLIYMLTSMWHLVGSIKITALWQGPFPCLGRSTLYLLRQWLFLALATTSFTD